MSIGADIYKLLVGPHGANSPNYGTNVFADYIPEGSDYPAVSFEMDPGELEQDWDGPNGFERHYATVIFHDQNREDLAAATSFIRDHLHGFSGSSFDGGVSGTITLSNQILDINVSPGASYYEEETDMFIREMELEIQIQN